LQPISFFIKKNQNLMLTANFIEEWNSRSKMPVSGIQIPDLEATRLPLSGNIQKHNSLQMFSKLHTVANSAETARSFSSAGRRQISVGTEENFRRDGRKFPSGRKNISVETEIYVRRDGNSDRCLSPFFGLETGRKSSTGRQKSKSK
jgi:hypothetical protein